MSHRLRYEVQKTTRLPHWWSIAAFFELLDARAYAESQFASHCTASFRVVDIDGTVWHFVGPALKEGGAA